MKKEFITIDDKISRGKLVISSVKQFERKSITDSPSVKIVLSGKEHYQIEGREYTLSENRFIVVDKNSSEDIAIDAPTRVKGICIYPNKALLNEVAQTRLSSYGALLDRPFEKQEIRLMHNRYNLTENKTGQFLQQQIPFITQLGERNEGSDLDEFLTGLAECIVDDQLSLEGKLKNLSSVKKATQEELYRRVGVAKIYMEDNFTQNMSLDDLAQAALLSKYHFSRTFKDLFLCSPYQYLLQVRLQKAKELLAQDYSYNETSLLIGFSDGKNLRKAVKRFL